MASSNSLATPFISAGVRQDLNSLFNKFNALESARLSDFTSNFRELKFDTILHHRISPTEYIEHAEFVLQQAGNYFRAQDDSQNMRSVAARIFGIYTTYALYHCQPTDYVCKIKVTTQQMKELLDFEKFLVSEKHLDAVACLHILLAKQAFQIGLFQSDYDPASHKKYINEEETWKISKMDEPFDNLRTLVDGEIFTEISLLHRSYMKGKRDLSVTENYVDAKSPITTMKEIIEKHEILLEERQSTGIAKNLDDTGSSRGHLRTKAYTGEMKHTRNRRYLDPNMEENFAHLKTFGDLAQEILEEEEQTPSTSKEPPKKKAKRKKNEPIFFDEEAEAAEVLKNSLEGIFKAPEEMKAKANPKKTPKRKENATSIGTPDQNTDTPGFTTTLKLSPEKKPKIPDEWSSKLRKYDRVKNAADKALQRIESRIKQEAENEEI